MRQGTNLVHTFGSPQGVTLAAKCHVEISLPDDDSYGRYLILCVLHSRHSTLPFPTFA